MKLQNYEPTPALIGEHHITHMAVIQAQPLTACSCGALLHGNPGYTWKAHRDERLKTAEEQG